MAITIDSECLFLIPEQWGHPREDCMEPHGEITNAAVHNIAAAPTLYPVGTVIKLWNTGAGIVGWTEFTFLKFENTGAPASAAKQVCVQDAAGAPFTVTNDPDHALVDATLVGCLRPAVLISAMTDAMFGWFWTGGVCPEGFVAAMGGTYGTDGSVVVGPIQVQDLTADEMGFGKYDTGATPPKIAIGSSDTAD